MSSLATVARYGETNGTTVDPSDFRVIRALEDASAFIRTYTGRTFDLVEADEVLLDGTGRDSVLLPQIPAIAVLSVSVTDRWSSEPELLEPDDWLLDSAGILWRNDGECFPVGHANVDVVYDHGYQSVPPAIQAACVAIATFKIATGGGTTSGPIEQEQILSYSVTYGSTASTTTGDTSKGPTVGTILELYGATGLTDEPMVPASS